MKATLLSVIGLGAAASLNLVDASPGSPVLAFGSSQVTTTLLSGLAPADSLSAFSSRLFSPGSKADACNLDAIVLVSTDHLDRTTFANLRHASPSLRRRALDAPTQLTFDTSSVDASETFLGQARWAKMLDESCGGETQRVAIKLGGSVQPAAPGQRSLVDVQVDDLKSQEELLLTTLAEIDDKYPQNLVIVASSAGPSLWKRQYLPSSDDPTALQKDKQGNWTEPEGGIFNRYQLFSSAQILILLLVFGILIPACYVVIGQLATVQVPDQIGVRKDPITGDKKNQ